MSRPMPKFTKTPPALVAAFEAAKPDDARVTKKTMFGYPAYFLNGNMFAFTFGTRVAVRLDEARRSKMGKAGGGFEIMPGRPMNEYVEIPAADTKGAGLKKWIAEGLACAERVPAKRTTKTRAAKAPSGRTR